MECTRGAEEKDNAIRDLVGKTQKRKIERLLGSLESRPATSNRKCLPSQKSCHYLNQGRTLNNILMKAAHWITYFDLKQNIVKADILKGFES